MSLLDALKKKTQLAADTASLSEIRRFKLDHATNNQALIRQAITSPEYHQLLDLARKKGNNEPDLFYDHLLVAIGSAILKEIPGTLSTQIDPQITFDTEKILARCRRLISLFEDAGADCKRLILKIPASWEGVSAAKILEKEQVRCNITLIFSLFQATAAFEANATMIAPYVGRVSDWFAAQAPHRAVNADPGVHFVQQILAHAKQLSCRTQVMAASFRSFEQIKNLVQSHYLTIGPKLLASLSEQPNIASLAIESDLEAELQITKNINRDTFYSLFSQDPMASTLFAEGLQKFTKDYLEVIHLLHY